jgi:hypothetical protein
MRLLHLSIRYHEIHLISERCLFLILMGLVSMDATALETQAVTWSAQIGPRVAQRSRLKQHDTARVAKLKYKLGVTF